MPRAIQTITVITILGGVVGLFSLCLGSFAAITMGEIGPMAHCALAQAATLCSVTVTQHLQFWQQVIVTTSPTATLLAWLLVVTVFSRQASIGLLLKVAALLKYSAGQLLAEPALRLGDYLRLAFSQGILHPKIY